MDRFIAFHRFLCISYQLNLKSNMDRFIEKECCRTDFIFKDLKSNMDRFIADTKRNIKKFVKI